MYERFTDRARKVMRLTATVGRCAKITTAIRVIN